MVAIDHDRQLQEMLQYLTDQYDPALDLLERSYSGPTYHTTMESGDMVHPTKPSLTYALGLLDGGEADDEERAFDVLDTVLDYQDLDPENDTYGIWPWFHEEPLEEMSPPDWNWADFLGKRLLLIQKRHGDRLPDELQERVQKSVFAACDAIIERDVRIGYTNIAIMGAFVTLIAGEVYDEEEYRTYGANRLQRFYDHTTEYDSFEEYNSPHYTPIAVTELSSILTETETETARTLAEELTHLGWETIAEHFHPPTEQWSGPHSRTYSTLLDEKGLSFIQLGTEGEVALLDREEINYDPMWYGNDIHCPTEFRSLFTTVQERRIRDQYNEAGGTPLTGTTYLAETFSLGTFDRSETWDQAHPVVAYVDNGGEPTFVRLRVMKDGHDFASGFATSAQIDGSAVVGVNFLTDGGDTHPGLDPTDGSIDCEDFRIRVEIGGNLAGVELDGATDATVGDTYGIDIGDTPVSVQYLRSGFGDGPAETRVNRNEDTLDIDHVIHDGAERSIEFGTIEDAAFGFGLAFGDDSLTVDVKERDDMIHLAGHTASRNLAVSIPRAPAEHDVLLDRSDATVEEN